MTQNQIYRWEVAEKARNNQVLEELTRRRDEMTLSARLGELEETSRHNRATELNAEGVLGVQREGNRINKQNADTNRYNAETNRQNAYTNERNAYTNERNAATNERNARSNALQATSAYRQSTAALRQADVAALSQQETVRHNQELESQGWENVDVARKNAMANYNTSMANLQNARSNSRQADAAESQAESSSMNAETRRGELELSIQKEGFHENQEYTLDKWKTAGQVMRGAGGLLSGGSQAARTIAEIIGQNDGRPPTQNNIFPNVRITGKIVP